MRQEYAKGYYFRDYPHIKVNKVKKERSDTYLRESSVSLWRHIVTRIKGVAFLDKVLESFNNSHMSQWTYFDGLPQK